MVRCSTADDFLPPSPGLVPQQIRGFLLHQSLSAISGIKARYRATAGSPYYGGQGHPDLPFRYHGRTHYYYYYYYIIVMGITANNGGRNALAAGTRV